MELRDDQRTDLRLRLRHGQPQGQSRCFVCRALLTQQLVADLRPVAVRDHQFAFVEQNKSLAFFDCIADIGENFRDASLHLCA